MRAIDRNVQLGTAEVRAAGHGLCIPVGPGQPADPLPEHAAAPPVGDEPRPVPLLEAVLEDARDPLMRLEIPHTDTLLEIDPLGTERGAGGKLGRAALSTGEG